MAHRPPASAADPILRALESVVEVSPRAAPQRRSGTTRKGLTAASALPEADVFLASIIRSKVQSPPVRVQTLARKRLLDWLHDHVDDRLKLIMAEAGYGKTTLLADFARRGSVPCIWYRLETSDGDWVTFLNYLIAAVREVLPDFGERTAAMLRQLAAMNPPRDVVIGSFLSELGETLDGPALLILDDFQLVDESEDAQAILEHLLERAPAGLSLVISTRRRPGLRLGRLTAQGAVAELGTDDLRFSQPETEELFRSTYGHPLEPDLLTQVDSRTEGWPASLQLLYSSIRERKPSEVRAFIRDMSGADGSLYDFLAEEVLGHLGSEVARFVTSASILERVVPAYAVALYSVDEAPTLSQVHAWLDEAEDLGLLGRSSATSVSRRFHPLLHEFLLRRLLDLTTLEQRRDMHLSVAEAAETSDWLTACHHFIEGGEFPEAMRVLNDSAADALGTGSWGDAAAMIPRIVGVEAPAAVRVLQARELVDRNLAEALQMLESLVSEPLSPAALALVRHARVAAFYRAGNGEKLLASLADLIEDPGTPESFREIATIWRSMLLTVISEGSRAVAAKQLVRLGERQARAGSHFHAAISYHNALCSEHFCGQYQRARELGTIALEHFADLAIARPEVFNTQSVMAQCAAELGMYEIARHEAKLAADPSSDVAYADAFAESASTLCSLGEVAEAALMQAEAHRRMGDGRSDLGTIGMVLLTDAQLLLAAGEPGRARATLASSPPHIQFDMFPIARATWDAIAGAAAGHSDAGRLAREAAAVARKTDAWHFEARLAVVDAAVDGRDSNLQVAIQRAARQGQLALLDTADVLAQHLHRLVPIPLELEESITRYPHRWLMALRIALGSENAAAARTAARVLARHGTQADVPRLVAFERMYSRGKRNERLGPQLARRVSPVLLVRDLGRVRYEVDGRVVEVTRTRRKAASLLVLLLTRPGNTATKDQVMEELWPDLNPTAAANSLNQTLYFLRRDIDEFYDENTSADYVVFESELLWLDADLVQADSARFLGAASSSMQAGTAVAERLNALDHYHGKFAPEFEYEEWSMAWRDQLHASYLHLARSVELELVDLGEFEGAAGVSRETLSIDPQATEFQRDLVWLYARLGTNDAAQAQYVQYAQALRNDLGADPPSFAAVCAEAPRGPSSLR